MDGLLTVFLSANPFCVNPLQICRRSSKIGPCFGDICWHGGVTDERDVIRTSSMGIRAIRTLMDALWMRYGYLIL